MVNVVTLFLFGDAHKEHWKVSLGDVVAVLNPSIKSEPKKVCNLSRPSALYHFIVSRPSAVCSTNVRRLVCVYIVYLLKKLLVATTVSISRNHGQYSF